MARVSVSRGSILDLDVECIVNSANMRLIRGSGLSGQIHKAAGPELESMCAQLGPIKPGSAILTPGFKLKQKYIIHAVGPVYNRYPPEEAQELLSSTYRSIFKLVKDYGISSVAIPCISTGVYGYPKAEAACVAVSVTLSSVGSLDCEVVFSCYSNEDFEIYSKLLG